MAPLGPFGRSVLVAVSGGADSMALAYLAAQWRPTHALVVDHGLRAESAVQADVTATRLMAFGVASTILRAGLAPGPAASERARSARYALLLRACRDRGCPDLLVAHHAGDQAETVQMRQEAGSLAAGLAGIGAIAYRDDARLLRPLLTIPGARLRATLRQAGVAWLEDPTNRDERTARGRLRATMDAASVALALALGRRHGQDRTRAEHRLAAELATVRFHPAGFALIAETISDSALSAVIWTISGRPYPPPRAALAAGLSTRSIHGVLLRPGGRLGLAIMVAREPNAVAPPSAATAGMSWDGRFRVSGSVAGLEIGALGADAARIGRRGPLPSIIRRSLPTLRCGNEVVAVPHLGFPGAASCRSVSILFNPTRPAAGAPFVNPSAGEGM